MKVLPTITITCLPHEQTAEKLEELFDEDDLLRDHLKEKYGLDVRTILVRDRIVADNQ